MQQRLKDTSVQLTQMTSQCINEVHVLACIQLSLCVLHRMGMYMCRLRDRMTYLNVSYPWMDHNLLDGNPMRRIWFKHLANQAPTGTRAQVVDSRWVNRVLLFLLDRNGARRGVGGVEPIRHLGDTPRHF